ncbi:MAG: hypothetical protein PHZ07_01430 [Patescibacteria group bacterium]|nr:hypothetical protein [Patescibacteria group bacterium]MDD4303903.1 hypothetical protein [Patescibacteria group bacterium]MDD4695110.1 hypothetical protein [Patescibacteria group bacterium]
MEPLYRSILKKAWQITWKYKFLWFFGVFALWLGNGGEMQIFFNTMYSVEDMTSSIIPQGVRDFFLLDALHNAQGFLGILNWATMVLIMIIIAIIVIWIIIISQTAIIKATNDIAENKPVKFKDIFNKSKDYFIEVLGLNFVSKFLITLIVLVIAIPLLLFVIQAGGEKFKFVIGIIVWLFFLPVATIISFVIKYAINFVIIKGEKFVPSISKAWNLFKTNWLISIEMMATLLIINTFIGLIVIYLTLVILGPYNMDLLVIYAFTNGDITMVLFKIIPLVVLYLFVGMFISVFQTSAWALLFNELTSGKKYSKVIRVVASLSNYMKTKNQIVKVSDINKIPADAKLKRRRGRPKARD